MIITVDFETYYSADYSLSKLSTQEYVRSEQFEVIGVSVQMGRGAPRWYPAPEVPAALGAIDSTEHAVLCHNTRFDGAILAWRYGWCPKLWLDTMSMARARHDVTTSMSLAALAEHYHLGRKGDALLAAKGKRYADFSPEELATYGQYCCNDTALTRALFDLLRVDFPRAEFACIDAVLRMFTQPVLVVDSTALRVYLDALEAAKTELLKAIPEEVLMSNAKFAEYLGSLGVIPPTKLSPATGKQTLAFAKTDPGFLALQEHPDLAVQTAVAARLGVRSTIAESRTRALLNASAYGALPVALNYYGAHTGRFSGAEGLNLQNLPARGGDKTLRRSLRAPPGHVLVAGDLSQIEARLLAWVAGQSDLVQAFRDKRDVYCEFATVAYGREITPAEVTQRAVGKSCTLGLGYGMGAARLRESLAQGIGGVRVDLPEEETARLVKIYRDKNHMIPALWRRASAMLWDMVSMGEGELAAGIPYSMHRLMLPSGFSISYPHLQLLESGEYSYIASSRDAKKLAAGTGDETWTRIYGAKVVENLIQALAACIIREHMVILAQLWGCALQVHDELVFCVPGAQQDEAVAAVSAVMSTPPAWAPDLPLACSVGVADNFGDV